MDRSVVLVFLICIIHLSWLFVGVCSGSQQLCSGDVASYSLRITIDGYSELQASVGEEPNYDILCIQSQNRASLTVFIDK